MPVLPDFQPEGHPGEASGAFAQGVSDRNSWMAQAQERQLREQEMQQRAQEVQKNEILKPVIEAKAQADLVGAASQIAGAKRIQEFRTQASLAFNTANNEFLDASQLADWNEKSNALAALQAKYQWMSLVPEYKGFIDTINDERLKAHGSAVADAKLEEQLTAHQMQQEAATERANILAESRRDVAGTNAGAKVESAGITAKGRAETSDKNRESRVDIAKFKTYQAAALQNDKDAAKATDADSAAIYRKHAEEFRAKAEEELAKPVEPVKFNVPGAAPEDTPAQEAGPAETKLYQPPSQPGAVPSFTAAVKTPDDVLSAMQQMVNDGAITPEQARDTLEKLGFKKKGK